MMTENVFKVKAIIFYQREGDMKKIMYLFCLLLGFSNNIQAKSIELININRDPESIIRRLNFIGPQMAKRIVDYRKTLPDGRFKSLEDFRNMPKIKEIVIKSNKDRIIF